MKLSGKAVGIFALSAGVIAGHASSTLLDVDYPKLVSRADLHLNTPAARSEEGLPVGNR